MMTTFKQLGLHPDLVQTITELGYEQPTPIQEALIPVLLSGRDALGQAQTGTGKTAAFALPILHAMTSDESNRNAVQALVVVPTRELAVQVASAVHTYGRGANARVLPVYGGQAYSRQTNRLRRGVDVVVGTPGRLLDLIRQGSLNLSAVQTVVLDEADEMLSMGFIEDIQTILDATPDGRRTALLSATMPPAIQKLAKKYLRNPEVCRVAHVERTGAAITHRAHLVYAADKPAAVLRVLETQPFESALVFAHTRAATAALAGTIAEAGYTAEALHGDMTQSARTEVLQRFRAQRFEVLVATDVAARGLDIDHLTLVINSDLPREPETYVHRIGRTGRAGRSGTAVSLVTPNQQHTLRRTSELVRQPIPVEPIPTPEDVARLRQERFAATLAERLGNAFDSDRRLVTELVAEGHDPMEIAAAALAMARPESHLAPVPTIRDVRGPKHGSKHSASKHDKKAFSNRPSQPSGGHVSRSANEAGMVRLALNAGRTVGVQPNQVVSAIARHAEIPGKAIGKILIRDRQTLVDVPEGMVDQVLAGSGGYRIGKHLLTVEEA